MKKLYLYLFGFAALIAATAGCAVQGYSGAPSSDVATVYFEQHGRVSLKNTHIDGTYTNNFSYGIAVRPGDHNAGAEYQMASGECPMYSIGCVDTVVLGKCDIQLTNLSGGRTYTIEIKSDAQATPVRVYDAATEEDHGRGSCIPSKDEFHGSVLRRRSTIGK